MSQFANRVPRNRSIHSSPWSSRFGVFGITLALAAGLGNLAIADKGGPQADLGGEVVELFSAHCAACHTPESNALGGVRYRGDLDSILDLPRLRMSEVVDLTNPRESELYERIVEGEMPPRKSIEAGHGRPLDESEAQLVLDWIVAGAPPPAGATKGERIDGEARRKGGAPASQYADGGRAAFMDACTTCHPAGRALKTFKSLPQWRSTVLRMGEKPGARLASANVDAIASFLAANSAHRAEELDVPFGGSFDPDELHVNGTLSGLLRGSSRAERVENKNFTAEAWAQIQWRPEHGPASAKITACTTCHSSSNAEGRAVEVLEASFRFDIDQALGSPNAPVQAATEFGRISVPFGAFGSQSNPGAYRTVTRPLIFSMGQLVDRSQTGPAILPMPYADEGFLLNLEAPLFGGITTELDAYLVNGLQGTLDVDFYQSRAYSDNNDNLASGARLTIGTPQVTLGASAMSGYMEEGEGLAGRLAYQIQGLDLSVHLFERLRVTAEVARRRNNQVFFGAAFERGDVEVEGYVLEADVLLLKDAGLSLITRADSSRYLADAAPFGSDLGTHFKTHRFTWGFDLVLAGGSSLMINHEHWSTPGDMDSVDVVGMRWVTSF
jgi:mono/diheme cytochrome c family protein